MKKEEKEKEIFEIQESDVKKKHLSKWLHINWMFFNEAKLHMSHYSNLYMFVTTLVVEVLVPKVIVSGGLQRNTGRSQTTKQTPFLWVVR